MKLSASSTRQATVNNLFKEDISSDQVILHQINKLKKSYGWFIQQLIEKFEITPFQATDRLDVTKPHLDEEYFCGAAEILKIDSTFFLTVARIERESEISWWNTSNLTDISELDEYATLVKEIFEINLSRQIPSTKISEKTPSVRKAYNVKRISK